MSLGDAAEKPITEVRIPGTSVPDVTRAEAAGLIASESKRFMSRVAVTTAILATMASLSGMFSSSHLNRAMLDQIRAADQWSFFQAKGVKLAVLESRMELLTAMGTPPVAGDAERAERYRREQEEIMAEARIRESGAEKHRQRHATMAAASTAFQVAIALAAVALLSKRAVLWYLAMGLGVVGTGFFVMGVM